MSANEQQQNDATSSNNANRPPVAVPNQGQNTANQTAQTYRPAAAVNLLPAPPVGEEQNTLRLPPAVVNILPTPPTDDEQNALRVPPAVVNYLPPPRQPVQQQQQRNVGEANAIYARIPLPQLNPADIEAWFMSLDYWFPASGIHNDRKKFNTVLASLEPGVLPQLRTIIERAPAEDRYEYLRGELVLYYSDSHQRRMTRLLNEMELGDLRPSRLYHEMRRVAGNSLSEDALKGLWARRLPEHARVAVVAATGPIGEALRIADAITDALQPLGINAIQQPLYIQPNAATHAPPQPSTSNQSSEIAQMSAKIDKITKAFNEMKNRDGRSRSRSRGRSNSHQRDQSTDNECWYHRRYGREASKCRSPCRHRKPATGGPKED